MKRAFEAEAKVWFFIPQHPNVVSAHSYATVMGRSFITMDFYRNGDLKQFSDKIGGFGKDVESITLKAIQICDALIHASANGLEYHGDLKPENCLVSDDRQSILLSDFGLSRMTENKPEASKWSSPYFAAPEVIIRGAHGRRADIFSFGLLLLWLWDGVLPDRNQEFGVEERLLSGEHSPFHCILDRCCRVILEDRYETFDEVRGRLADLLLQQCHIQAPAVSVSIGMDFAQAMTVAEDMLVAGDPSKALQACEAAIEDCASLRIPFILDCITVIKVNALLSLRKFSDARSICAHTIPRCAPSIRPDFEALLRTASILPEEMNDSLEFSGMSSTAQSKELNQLNRKAQSLTAAGEYSTSLKVSRDTLTRFGNWDCTYVNIANAWAGLENWIESTKAFQQAIECNPHNKTAYYNFALALFQQNFAEHAMTNLDLALAIDPLFSQGWAAKARLFKHESNPDEARRCFRHAIELDPENRRYKREMASCIKKGVEV